MSVFLSISAFWSSRLKSFRKSIYGFDMVFLLSVSNLEVDVGYENGVGD
jgi:hypothetical protein